MNAVPDRGGRRAAVIGVGRYRHRDIPDIPAAHNNVEDMARLLTAGGGFATEHCHALVDPEHGSRVGEAVARAAREADDILLVYYTGHGLLDRRGRLHLALPDSDPGHLGWSSVPFTMLRDELAESRARTRILILDCCFSGRAFEAMSSPATVVDGQLDIHGTYTISSSAANETSLAPQGHRNTAFTAALLSAATDTDLTLDQLYVRVDDILYNRGHPRPRRRSINSASELRLFARTSDGDSEQEREWRRAAARGDAQAMTKLADLHYARGEITAAHEWLRRAAELGDLDAMGTLASLLHKVKHVSEAEGWWRLAALGGHADSMFNLAVVLDHAMQLDEALTWYRRAAETGNKDAMHNLAIRLRYRGQLEEAAQWWQRAGHRRAQGVYEKPRGLTSPR
ncbi:caspase, EACC1-associated type [Nocardia heshunensis]